MTRNCGFSSLHAMAFPQSDRTKVFGTWDFKWPAGTHIRVAFQELPPLPEKLSTDDLIRKVIRYASRWNDGTSQLNLRFLDERLPAPDPELPAGRSRLARLKRPIDYDVLVSLAPLPVRVSYAIKDRPTTPGMLWREKAVDDENYLISLPTAQLGRFALRCDYGVPTVYLGRPYRTTAPNAALLGGDGQVPELAAQDESIVDYFGPADGESKTGDFEATIVHEFGHVLGIPHLHQSPLAHLRWRPLDEICERVEHGTGVQVDEDFVRGQLMLPLPSTRSERGDVRFSDWTVPPMDRNGDAMLFDSVMVHPLLQFMLVEAPRPPVQQGKPSRLTSPRDMDFAFLRAMY